MDDGKGFAATDLIDLGLLGLMLQERPALGRLPDRLRGICAPWLSPTLDVVERRLNGLAASSALACLDDDATVTAGGHARFVELMLRPIRATSHDLRFCAENLKLAFLDRLPEPQRDRVGADLLAARKRCLACVAGMLDGCGPDRPSLRTCLSHQRRLMTAELEVVAQALALEV
jgi:hypothetical protein